MKIKVNLISILSSVLLFKLTHSMMLGKYTEYFNGELNEMAFTLLTTMAGIGLLIHGVEKA